MIGRAAYHTPYLLADIEKEIFNNFNVPSRQDVVEQLIPYVKEEIKRGTRLNQIMRQTGVKTFIIHARKAMLGKFTPKQNLNIPHHLFLQNNYMLSKHILY